ncbi:MAG: hypothetical protein ACXU8N_13780 [Telluria sp.]
MKILRSLSTALGFGANVLSGSGADAAEQAVIVQFHYGSRDLTGLFALEDRLGPAISAAGVGEYDGNEIAVDGSVGRLYMFGPSADALFEVVRPILASAPFMLGAQAVKRYGPPAPDTREAAVWIA